MTKIAQVQAFVKAELDVLGIPSRVSVSIGSQIRVAVATNDVHRALQHLRIIGGEGEYGVIYVYGLPDKAQSMSYVPADQLISYPPARS